MKPCALFSIKQTETLHDPFKKIATTVFGPRLYNSLPKYMRDIERVKKNQKFKFLLNRFLALIRDESKMLNYAIASGSNSILDQLTQLRAQGIYKVVESPTRPLSSLNRIETVPSIQVPTSVFRDREGFNYSNFGCLLICMPKLAKHIFFYQPVFWT